MRQELKFFRTEKAIEIEAEGQVIASIPMIEEQPTPAPESEPQPKSVTYTFDKWQPQVTHTRLTEPKTQWAVLNCLSENQKSVHLPQNVQSVEGIVICKFLPNYFQKNCNKQISAITCSIFLFVSLVAC